MDNPTNHQLPDEFYIAMIRRPHGVRGDFRVQLLSGDLERLKRIEEFMLVNPENEADRFPMRLRHPQSNVDSLILSAEPWTTPEEVKKYAGWYMAVERHFGQELESDEYYLGDLIGLTVETIQGQRLGRVEEVFIDRSQPLFCIRSKGEADIFLPALPEFVELVDLDGGKLIINPPHGLIELYREEDEA